MSEENNVVNEAPAEATPIYNKTEALDAIVAKHFSDEPVETAISPAVDSLNGMEAFAEEPKPQVEEVAEEVESDEEEYVTSSEFLESIKEENNRRTRQDELAEENKELRQYADAKELFKTDPARAMALLGLDPRVLNNQLAENALENVDLDDEEVDGNVEEVDERDERLNQLEQHLQVQEDTAIIDKLYVGLDTEIKDNPNYEMINTFDAADDVVNLIIASARAGQDLTYAQAAGMVEAQLDEIYYSGYEKLRNTNKYKTKYSSEKPQVNERPSERPSPISNRVASQVTSERDVRRRYEDDSPEYYADMARRHNL